MKPLYLFPVLSALLLFSCQKRAAQTADSSHRHWDVLQYPQEVVSSMDRAGISERELTERASASLPEYVQSGGHEDVAGIIRSPYYKVRIDGTDIPSYASLVFNRTENTGALHSFSEVYVDSAGECSLNIELENCAAPLKDALVLPASHGIKAGCSEGVVRTTITKKGIYTFLFNGAGQDYGYTLFVREKVDEEAEIKRYREQYGCDNVTVYEPGVHELDYLNFVEQDSVVVYLKQGAYLRARHLYEIISLADEGKWEEEGALFSNAIQQIRYPFVNFFRCSHVVLAGHGAIDMTSLDRRERKGVVFNYCNDVTVRGIKIVNAPEWSFMTYCCKDVDITHTDILGYRSNADGFAICNTHNATVSQCFVRTADDQFEVKTLGGSMDTRDVTYTDCVAWGGYARCYGICGEVVKDISDVKFRNCAVVYRDGVWDNDRIGSLVITAEQCGGSIQNIVFDNIEVFHDEGRAILVKIYDPKKEHYKIENILFRNVSYTSQMPSKIEGNAHPSNTVQVRLENVMVGGERVESFSPHFIIGKSCNVEIK